MYVCVCVCIYIVVCKGSLSVRMSNNGSSSSLPSTPTRRTVSKVNPQIPEHHYCIYIGRRSIALSPRDAGAEILATISVYVLPPCSTVPLPTSWPGVVTAVFLSFATPEGMEVAQQDDWRDGVAKMER